MPNPAFPEELPLAELLTSTFVLLFRTAVFIVRAFLEALNIVFAEEKRNHEQSVRNAETAHASAVGIKPDFTSRRFIGLDIPVVQATTGGHASRQTPPERLSAQPKPHKTLWYSDGNIILASDRHLFRIYKGQLAQQSSVFSDMLSLPQVSPAVESTDAQGITDKDHWKGIPIVRMAGDSDMDVTNLLMALLHRR